MQWDFKIHWPWKKINSADQFTGLPPEALLRRRTSPTTATMTLASRSTLTWESWYQVSYPMHSWTCENDALEMIHWSFSRRLMLIDYYFWSLVHLLMTKYPVMISSYASMSFSQVSPKHWHLRHGLLCRSLQARHQCGSQSQENQGDFKY